EIVSKAHIAMNDSGYIAVYGSYYAEGGTKSEALVNLLDEINAERGFKDLRRRMNKRFFWKSIGMN
ncbi:MAG: hypothetical protein LLG04_14260, partial [Parachlamydia sp.]|nr:hypothetical protein [Parachlamydia sp.]